MPRPNSIPVFGVSDRLNEKDRPSVGLFFGVRERVATERCTALHLRMRERVAMERCAALHLRMLEGIATERCAALHLRMRERVAMERCAALNLRMREGDATESCAAFHLRIREALLRNVALHFTYGCGNALLPNAFSVSEAFRKRSVPMFP